MTAASTRAEPAPSPAEPRAGDRIGRYVVEGLLGRGGMGVVVAAHDPELARQVAVKLVRPGAGDRPYRQRLVREARAMARLEHDNVVRVYDAGEHEGEVFVAMELVRGETVGSWMRAAPRPWREVLARFVAAGRGLAAAHRAGLVHRDFKPDNVLVRASDGRVCVTDFGLAIPDPRAEPADEDAATGGVADAATGAAAGAASRPDHAGRPPDASAPGTSTVTAVASVDAPLARGTPRSPARTVVTRIGAAVGTPAYMAPEQHRGGDVDARADVFSFCVSLYEGLHGARPFAPGPGAGGRAAWVEAIRAGRVSSPPPGRRIPAALRRVLLRGLAADPADRWPDMDALLAALARVQRSRRGRALAAAGLALAAGGAVAAMAWRGSAEAPEAYADGLGRLRLDDFHGAAAAFERATREAPDYAPAWVGLTRARQAEPDLPRARAALATALRLTPPGDRARRLEVEGLAAELDEKWDTAIDRYQAYVRFFPADVDVGLALADAQVRGGHFKESLATVQELRAASGDVRIELAEAKAAEMVSDWPRSIAAATRAITTGAALRAPGIVARASLRRSTARSKLRQREASLADLAAAGDAARQAGDRAIEARQLTTLTRVLRDVDDLAGAARAAEQAVALDREIGEPHNLAADLLNAAAAHAELGEIDRARPLYQEAFGILRELDDRFLLINALLGYGQLLTDRGERAEADPPLRESIRLSRAAGADPQVLVALGAIAWNDFGLGNLEQAEAAWREAMTLALRLGDTAAIVNAYDGVAIAQAARGDHAGAIKSQQQAVRLAEQVDPTMLAVERTWYAIQLADAGQYASAPELALPAADFLRDHQAEREEMLARSVAACALAALGRRAEATAQLALGRALLARPRPVDSRAKTAILLTRAAIQLGDRDAARAILASFVTSLLPSTPRDRVAVPWAEELAAETRRLDAARR